MKKISIYIFLLFVGINQTSAQKQDPKAMATGKDDKAKAILKQVSAKYRSYGSIMTDFTFTIEIPQSPKHTQAGTLITATKTGKYKVTLYDPANKTDIAQEIYNDGKIQWTYTKRDKEVQIDNVSKSPDAMNPATLFTMYEKGYKYLYTGEQKMNGKIYQAVELSPEDEKSSFFKIKLFIDKAKQQLYNAVIFDRNGSHYTYTLTKVVPNVKIGDATFVFDKVAHPGVGVNDLR
ncbi:LolA family protein [Mucilaginibacter myungsuensis]|uniref:Outer membrane lipoprotein carrier protein LolA n=1 Tax=Mucilaginibacter myungsuensis TaxID=649104 RepID=A0A929L3M5_9SPHI|nr:outer membrane lipoprotein carrier protein LolA [Mucilaginibacter myungsuensis]MBE9663869.1 outer membrane lipoprotein carrier protein LolA [Mucilaginibacter myungsuensis]MDN3598415.1 outer membrane lipoprotein carrier protein LolA [Mucilaginibacter myungsuensis]